MPKVILQISYEVKPDMREQYLALAAEMRVHFAKDRGKNYSMFEVKGKKNAFVEQFVCASVEEYETLEDNMTESSEALVDRLEGVVKEGTTRYTTLIELE